MLSPWKMVSFAGGKVDDQRFDAVGSRRLPDQTRHKSEPEDIETVGREQHTDLLLAARKPTQEIPSPGPG